jgi:hypothetical protein
MQTPEPEMKELSIALAALVYLVFVIWLVRMPRRKPRSLPPRALRACGCTTGKFEFCPRCEPAPGARSIVVRPAPVAQSRSIVGEAVAAPTPADLKTLPAYAFGDLWKV